MYKQSPCGNLLLLHFCSSNLRLHDKSYKKCKCSTFPQVEWLCISSYKKSGFFSVFLPLDCVFLKFSGYAVIYKWQTTQTLHYMTRATKNVYVAHSHWWNGCAFRRTRNLGFFPLFLLLDWVFRDFPGYAVIYK